MALRIGRRAKEDTGQPVDLPPPPPPPPPATPPDAPPPDAGSVAARRFSPKLLIIGGILFLAAVAAAYFLVLARPTDEELTEAPAASVPAPQSPVAATAPDGGAAGSGTPAAGAGAPTGGTGPSILPASPGQPPRMVPVPGVPTPVQPLPNQQAIPGKRIEHGESRVVTRPAPARTSSPAVKAELKRLWKLGAAAKRAKKINAARQYWQQAVNIASKNPGHQASAQAIQQAINKLPE